MHRLFETVILPLLEAVDARTVVEVGAGSERLTRQLLEQTNAVVHAVDPVPSPDPDAQAAGDERLVLHGDQSRSVLSGMGAVDLAILDGDPHRCTVISELRLLAADERRRGQEPPVVVVHNVGPPVPRVGLDDRTPRSGVRTAVDDFRSGDADRWRLTEVPGLRGVGVLATGRRLEGNPALCTVLNSFESTADQRADPAAERVDALEARLETLEHGLEDRLQRARAELARTRSALTGGELALSQARAELHRTDARLLALADEHDALSEHAVAAHGRLEAARGTIAQGSTRIGELEAELARQRGSAYLTAARADRLESQVSVLLEERQTIAEYVDRAVRSPAWRIGHLAVALARRLSLRHRPADSTLGPLQQRLEVSPSDLSGAGSALPAPAASDYPRWRLARGECSDPPANQIPR